jgi:hypothetical protein
MTIEDYVKLVVSKTDRALTVLEVTQKVIEHLEPRVRRTLNLLVEEKYLAQTPGGGGYRKIYHKPALRRRSSGPSRRER